MLRSGKISPFTLVRYLSLIVIGLFVIVACNPQDAPEAATEESTAPTVAPTEAAAPEGEETPAEADEEEAPSPAAEEEEASPMPEGQEEEEEAPAAAVETLRMGIFADEASLTPYTYITGFPGYYLLMLQYDALYEIDADGVPQPWLVSEAEISEDGSTYTLDLRDDVTWHDGTPFTAEDVA